MSFERTLPRYPPPAQIAEVASDIADRLGRVGEVWPPVRHRGLFSLHYSDTVRTSGFDRRRGSERKRARVSNLDLWVLFETGIAVLL